MGIPIDVGNRIKRARKSLGISQKELAKEAGCSPMTLYRYESGAGTPTLEVLSRIASALNIDVSMLLASSKKFALYEFFHFDDGIDYESENMQKLATNVFALLDLREIQREKELEAAALNAKIAALSGGISSYHPESFETFENLFPEKKDLPIETGFEPPQNEDDLTLEEKKELERYRDYLLWKRGRD